MGQREIERGRQIEIMSNMAGKIRSKDLASNDISCVRTHDGSNSQPGLRAHGNESR